MVPISKILNVTKIILKNSKVSERFSKDSIDFPRNPNFESRKHIYVFWSKNRYLIHFQKHKYFGSLNSNVVSPSPSITTTQRNIIVEFIIFTFYFFVYKLFWRDSFDLIDRNEILYNGQWIFIVVLYLHHSVKVYLIKILHACCVYVYTYIIM